MFDVSHLESDIRRRALRGGGATISASVLNYGFQTVGTIILARLLSPRDFGMVAMVSAFSLLVQNFGSWGFIEAVVQSEDIDHRKMSKLFWVNLGIMVLLTLAFMGLAPFIAWFFKEPQLKRITVVMSLSILFGGLSTCHLAVLIRNMKFHLTSLMNLLTGVISTVIAVIAATQGIGYWALVLRRIALPLGTSVLVWLFCRWRPGVPSRNASIARLLKFGIRTYGNYLVDYIRKSSDKIIIGKFFGTSPLGHYDRAMSLAGVLPEQLSSSLGNVGIATFSRLRNDPVRYLESYAKALSLLAFVAFPGSVWFTLVGRDIIAVLLGPQWSKAGELFTVLGPAIGIIIIYETNAWLHLSLGRPDRLLKWGGVVLATAVTAFFVGAAFGTIGVAAAYSVLYYLILFPGLIYAGRPMRIRASFFVSVLWKYWTAAFLAGAIYWGAMNGIDAAFVFYRQIPPLARIAFCLFLYSASYLCLVIALFRGLQPIKLLLSSLKSVVQR